MADGAGAVAVVGVDSVAAGILAASDEVFVAGRRVAVGSSVLVGGRMTGVFEGAGTVATGICVGLRTDGAQAASIMAGIKNTPIGMCRQI